MTQRRTPESMRDAGVTAEGVALIMPLIEMLDDKWPTRERFIQQAAARRPGLQLTKQRLSKELGSKYKPMGPEWEIAELIVELCTDEAEQPAATASIAGLYCRRDHPPARGRARRPCPQGRRGRCPAPAGRGARGGERQAQPQGPAGLRPRGPFAA